MLQKNEKIEVPMRTHDKRINDRFAELLKACDMTEMDEMKERIMRVIALYNMRTAHAVVTQDQESYARIVVRDDYDSQITILAGEIARVGRISRSVAECLEHARDWTTDVRSTISDEDIPVCCGEPMHIVAETSETVCRTCGEVRELKCSAAHDEQAPRDGMKVRRGGYMYMRHAKMWMERLQATERFTPNPEDILRVVNAIRADSARDIEWRLLRYSDVERYIVHCKLPKLRDHVPKVMCAIGARAPPLLQYDTQQIIMCDFENVMDVYTVLYPEPGNKPYYPFFFRKIIQFRFGRSRHPEALNAMRLLDYIESQERDTVIKNDKIFRAICEKAPSEYGLQYIPENI